jgi:uncharacterized DUF497 family protein
VDPFDLVEFEWDEENEERVRRCAEPYEVEEAVRDDDRVPLKRIVDGKKHWWILGETTEGRLLAVVLIQRRKNLVRPITARDPSPAEVDQYRISFIQRAIHE